MSALGVIINRCNKIGIHYAIMHFGAYWTRTQEAVDELASLRSLLAEAGAAMEPFAIDALCFDTPKYKRAAAWYEEYLKYIAEQKP